MCRKITKSLRGSTDCLQAPVVQYLYIQSSVPQRKKPSNRTFSKIEEVFFNLRSLRSIPQLILRKGHPYFSPPSLYFYTRCKKLVPFTWITPALFEPMTYTAFSSCKVTIGSPTSSRRCPDRIHRRKVVYYWPLILSLLRCSYQKRGAPYPSLILFWASFSDRSL